MMNQAERRQIERIGSWRKELDALHVRIAPRFKRREVGARAGRYLSGLPELCRYRRIERRRRHGIAVENASKFTR